MRLRRESEEKLAETRLRGFWPLIFPLFLVAARLFQPLCKNVSSLIGDVLRQLRTTICVWGVLRVRQELVARTP